MIATLISFYGPKSPDFARFIREYQALVAKGLGDAFQPYDLRQVHCTIASLDRVGESGVANQSFFEFRNRQVEMDLAGLLRYLRDIKPIQIQIGGFAEGQTPFASRGQPPYQRSFSMQDGKAVIMGWPIDPSGEVVRYPARLETLRRDLQRFGILHRYYKTDADVDNDFYLRIGLYDPAAVSTGQREKVERHLRQFLASQSPLTLTLRPADIAFALSDHHTLPPDTIRLLGVDDPAANVEAIMRLFGWKIGG
jgi:hypothetical protein